MWGDESSKCKAVLRMHRFILVEQDGNVEE